MYTVFSYSLLIEANFTLLLFSLPHPDPLPPRGEGIFQKLVF